MEELEGLRRVVSLISEMPEDTVGNIIYVSIIENSQKIWVGMYSNFPFNYKSEYKNLRVINFHRREDKLSKKLVEHIIHSLLEENDGILEIPSRRKIIR